MRCAIADYAPTAANIQATSTSVLNKDRLAGETITAGQTLYFKSSDSRWWKAANNSTAEVAGSVDYGIAMNGGAAGQPMIVCTGGDLTYGATGTVGDVAIISATSGGAAPIADISTNRLTILGVFTTGTNLKMSRPSGYGGALATHG